MSSPTVERRVPTGSRDAASTGTFWERSGAVLFLWSIPLLAFVLVMLNVGGHGS